MFKRYVIISNNNNSDNLNKIKKFYNVDSVSGLNDLDKIRNDFFRIIGDYVIKIMLDESGVDIVMGFGLYFEYFDSILNQTINQRDEQDSQSEMLGGYNVNLSITTVPAFSHTLLDVDRRMSILPFTFLEQYINDPTDVITSPKFTKSFYEELKNYMLNVHKHIKNEILATSIEAEKFLKVLFDKYVESIASTKGSNDSDILPSKLREDEMQAVLNAIRNFISPNTKKFIVHFKAKNIKISQNYMSLKSNCLIYDISKSHLSYYDEIRDLFYGQNEDKYHIIIEVKATDKDTAVTAAIKEVKQLFSIPAFLQYQRPFNFYGYQSQFARPTLSLETHVFDKENNLNEYGNIFSNSGRERKEYIEFNERIEKIIDVVESSDNLALRNGFEWFERGVFDPDPASKLLFHWIGLEQLFAQYGNKERRYEIISRLVIEDYKVLYSTYSNYNSIIENLRTNPDALKIIESSKTLKNKRRYTIDDIKYILSKINDDALNNSLDTFVKEFSAQRDEIVTIYKEYIKRKVFELNRIANMRNRIVHAGIYDERYFNFAERIESILHRILLQLTNYSDLRTFKSFFKEYDFLLRMPV